MNKCSERVNGRQFWNPGALQLRNDTKMSPYLKSLFFIVASIVYAWNSGSIQRFFLCLGAGKATQRLEAEDKLTGRRRGSRAPEAELVACQAGRAGPEPEPKPSPRSELELVWPALALRAGLRAGSASSAPKSPVAAAAHATAAERGQQQQQRRATADATDHPGAAAVSTPTTEHGPERSRTAAVQHAALSRGVRLGAPAEPRRARVAAARADADGLACSRPAAAATGSTTTTTVTKPKPKPCPASSQERGESV